MLAQQHLILPFEGFLFGVKLPGSFEQFLQNERDPSETGLSVLCARPGLFRFFTVSGVLFHALRIPGIFLISCWRLGSGLLHNMVGGKDRDLE